MRLPIYGRERRLKCVTEQPLGPTPLDFRLRSPYFQPGYHTHAAESRRWRSSTPTTNTVFCLGSLRGLRLTNQRGRIIRGTTGGRVT